MIILSYKENYNLSFDAVSIVGDFNGYDPSKNLMQKIDDTWSANLKLPRGKYKYRFFVFGGLLINDPQAGIHESDENNEIWSIMIIDDRRDRLLPNVIDGVNLVSYQILNNTISSFVSHEQIQHNSFDILRDRKVIVRFEFNHIKNLHSATILWFQPDGSLFMSDDVKVEGNGEDGILQVHFWLDIKELSPPLGMWKFMLLIDGLYIVHDVFSIYNNLFENEVGFVV